MVAKHEPTDRDRKVVKAMASYGMAQDIIAETLAISEPTLRKHYRSELALARSEFHTAIANRLALFAAGRVEGALPSDSLRACIFIAKTQLRWRESESVEVTGKDGKPIEQMVVIKLSKDDMNL